jgi:hypothetical protein
MNKLKVISISDGILFDDGTYLFSDHTQGCCEKHFLNFNDLNIEDFEGLEFDLTNDRFFNRIDGYGIELVPINGLPVRIAGHGYNNGYYSSNLDLIITTKDGKTLKQYNISECQDY